jgi:uroporphyrinogen decarboxylase
MVSVDSDGDCSELVPLMMRHGVNVFFPFEVQAGNEICDYRKQYPQLGIWGGLDKRVLAQSRRDIDCELEKIPAMARLGGRFVPQFDHLIPPDVPWDNFVYAAGRIREMCNN